LLNRKYFNPVVYLNKLIFYFNKYFAQRIEQRVKVADNLLSKHPPVFFLGAPRSGSTLAIQIIVDCFDIGYMSNRHCRWYGIPFLVEKIKRTIKFKKPSNYTSEHGVTFGDSETSECSDWWYRFFRRTPTYVTLKEVQHNKMKSFRHSIALLTRTHNKSILFKNLYESFRIQAIAHYIPEAIFIVTHRNEVENGHSILEVRDKVFGNYNTWWSMEPPNFDKLKQLPIHQQVIEQIRGIYAVIKKDIQLSGVSKDRIFHIDYEMLCDNPSEVINDLQNFFKLNSPTIERKSYTPPVFKIRKNIRINKKLYDAMKKYAESS
jgi:hypothetical protein